METDSRYDSFELGLTGLREAAAHTGTGRMDRFAEISAELCNQPGLAHVVGLVGLAWALPALGRVEEAMAITPEALTVARSRGNPYWVAIAHAALWAGL